MSTTCLQNEPACAQPHMYPHSCFDFESCFNVLPTRLCSRVVSQQCFLFELLLEALYWKLDTFSASFQLIYPALHVWQHNVVTVWRPGCQLPIWSTFLSSLMTRMSWWLVPRGSRLPALHTIGEDERRKWFWVFLSEIVLGSFFFFLNNKFK